MTENKQPEDERLKKRMEELRRLQVTLSGATVRGLMEFGIEWQEATGKLLKAGNRPEAEEKFQDAERRRQELRYFAKRGTLRK